MDSDCWGTEIRTLSTGDYTIEGLEGEFVIERKKNTGEFAQNITQARFKRELERLEKFRWPFLILDFSIDDILNFPADSGIPENKWKDLQVSAKFIESTLYDYHINYKTKIILAEGNGRNICKIIFKKMGKILEGRNE
jgi:ERCC4-type nuclease